MFGSLDEETLLCTIKKLPDGSRQFFRDKPRNK